MAQSNEILQAAKQICEEKNISLESVIETIEAALAVAFRKDFGEKNQNIKVEFDINTAQASVFDEKTVVTDEKAELTEKLKEEKKALEESQEDEANEKSAKGGSQPKADPSNSAGRQPLAGAKTSGGKDKKEEKPASEAESDEEKIDRFNPKTEITLSDAKELKKGSKLDDVIRTELTPPAAYGRMAAQTAKQVIIQRLREAERETIYNDFKDKEGEVINGTIQRLEGRMVLIDLGPTTALLPPSEQIQGERYASGQRFKFFVVAVNITPKGPEIILSRSHPDIVKKLFYLEVPEIGNGSVEIKSVAREAGARTKIAVFTNQKNIDPVGSCVGQRGSRVQTIISEIGGEKIDIIEWEEDSVKFIINALSPAKVLSVKIDEDQKTALAEVKEDQLSLAIGKAGQNVRLSAKLTGWKIDIVSDRGEKVSSANKKNADDEDAEEDKDKPVEDVKEKPAQGGSDSVGNDDDVKELKKDVEEEVKEVKPVEKKKSDKKDDKQDPSAGSHSGPEPSGPKAESNEKKEENKESEQKNDKEIKN